MADAYRIDAAICLFDGKRFAWARFDIDRKEMASASLADLLERYMKPATAAVRQQLEPPDNRVSVRILNG